MLTAYNLSLFKLILDCKDSLKNLIENSETGKSFEAYTTK
jgi:hypothetical protein